jgi:ceramide glucosyltransferase
LALWVTELEVTRFQKYSKPLPPPPPVLEEEVPFVTILRPIKGYDPNLDLCLSSTCLLDYPRSKFELVFCVASPTDTAIPVINHVLDQHPEVNARLTVGEEDVGPNPKIRNLSKAYREAAGDIVWVLDCNIWVPPGILRRSVQLLEGDKSHPGYKLVHHLPIAVDITDIQSHARGTQTPTSPAGRTLSPLLPRDPVEAENSSWLSRILSFGGGRMEESFLSSSHAKFYTAINTLKVAPCVVGKSEMFRRSHLAEVTRDGGEKTGLVYFSDFICEDHHISEKLFLTAVDDEVSGKRKWERHGFGDGLVFQPLEDMAVRDYLARRTRWIRVRKYETLSATFAESMTESIMCSLIGSYAVTTVPFFESRFGSAWSVFWGFWFLSMCTWAFCDRMLFNFLHSYKCTAVDDNTPNFIVDKKGRKLGQWILQWIGRELCAFPVWCCALWPGPINWRGRLYRIRWSDNKVEEIGVDGYKRQD